MPVRPVVETTDGLHRFPPGYTPTNDDILYWIFSQTFNSLHRSPCPQAEKEEHFRSFKELLKLDKHKALERFIAVAVEGVFKGVLITEETLTAIVGSRVLGVGDR